MKPETHACLERVPFFLFCTGSEKPRTVIANRKCTPTRDSVVPLVGRLPRRGLRGRFRRARQSVHGARKLESLPCGQAGENVYCSVVRVVLPSFFRRLIPDQFLVCGDEYYDLSKTTHRYLSMIMTPLRKDHSSQNNARCQQLPLLCYRLLLLACQLWQHYHIRGLLCDCAIPPGPSVCCCC